MIHYFLILSRRVQLYPITPAKNFCSMIQTIFLEKNNKEEWEAGVLHAKAPDFKHRILRD